MTNNKGKTENSTSTTLEIQPHQSLLLIPKRTTPSLSSGANGAENFHIYRKFLQKLQHSARHAFFPPPPLCEFTPFQRARNGLLGQHYSRVGGKQHFGACSVSSLHVLLSAVKNRVGLNCTVLSNHSHQSTESN